MQKRTLLLPMFLGLAASTCGPDDERAPPLDLPPDAGGDPARPPIVGAPSRPADEGDAAAGLGGRPVSNAGGRVGGGGALGGGAAFGSGGALASGGTGLGAGGAGGTGLGTGGTGLGTGGTGVF